jgi:anaerobic magnesium-protoporphyrin IX monomethyl ester cyclase
MDALLINVPEKVPSDFNEPLGMQYVGAFARAQGYEIDVCDALINNYSLERAVEYAVKNDYKMIGISTTFQSHLPKAVEFARRLRAGGVDCHIALGGVPASIAHQRLLTNTPEIDSVVVGEGEYPFSHLLRCISGKRDWTGIKGIAYRESEGVVFNRGGFIDDLDSLPFPRFFNYNEQPYSKYLVSMLSGRGCYASCSFCSLNVYYGLSKGRKCRYRSAGNIVDELEFLAGLGVKQVNFMDDVFLGYGKMGEKRALDFASALIARDLGIEYFIEARVTEMKESVLKPLMDSGLRRVFVGVESMSQPVLDYLNKGSKVEDNLKAIEVLEKLGLYYEIGFILFTPLETRGDLIENLKFLRDMPRLKPNYLSRLVIYEGTPLYESLQLDGMGEDDGRWFNYRFADKYVDAAYKVVNSIYRPLMSVYIKIVGLSVIVNKPFYERVIDSQIYQQVKIDTLNLLKHFDGLLIKILDTLIEGLENGSFAYADNDTVSFTSSINNEISILENTTDNVRSLLPAI